MDVSNAAQFMRFVSNVGMKLEFDQNKSQGAIKCEVKASLTLAPGVTNMTVCAPDSLSWALARHMHGGKTLNMGMMRVCVEGEFGPCVA